MYNQGQQGAYPNPPGVQSPLVGGQYPPPPPPGHYPQVGGPAYGGYNTGGVYRYGTGYNPRRFIKQGAQGAIAVCLLFFGIFVAFVGAVLTGIGYSSFGDDDFFTGPKVFKVLGPIALSIGLVMIIVSMTLCCTIVAAEKKKHNQQQQQQQQANITNTYAPGVQPACTVPVGPQVSGVPPNMQQPAPPPGAGYAKNPQGMPMATMPSQPGMQPTAPAMNTVEDGPPPAYNAVVKQ